MVPVQNYSDTAISLQKGAELGLVVGLDERSKPPSVDDLEHCFTAVVTGSAMLDR